MAPAHGNGTLPLGGLSLLLSRFFALWRGWRKSRPAQSRDRTAGAALTFFGGKGGVGKTTCAGAYAIAAAQGGRRVLLVSTDPAHSIGDLLARRLDERPRRVDERLDALEIDPAAAARRYVAEVKETLRRTAAPELAGEAERQVDLAAMTPGAEESALLDAVTSCIVDNEAAYDELIFDTAPTGHTLHLLTLPEVMSAWTDGLLARRERAQALWQAHRGESHAGAGNVPDPARDALLRRRDRFSQVRALLLDPARTHFYFVLNADRLSLAETDRAVRHLSAHAIPVAGIIVNRVLPDLAEGQFYARRRETEMHWRKAIARTFGEMPRLEIPFQAEEPQGIGELKELARHFDAWTER